MNTTVFDGCEVDDLAEAIGQLRALMTVIHAQLIDVVGVFQEREGHTIDAMPDAATWLAARSNLALPTARREADIATRAPAIPALMHAWRSGRISWDQLLVLAPVATPETDTELAEQAPGWTYHSTVVNARALKPVSAEEALEQHRERFVQLVRRHDSTLRIRGLLSGDQGAIVEAALNRLADSLPEEGRLEGGEPARRGARMADALVAMCEAHPEVLAQNPARPLVVVHIDVEPFTHHDNSDSGGHGHRPAAAKPTTIGAGWTITNDTARRLACDCRWQIIADDPNGQPVGISRDSRRIPPWLARVVARRDQHRCRWPRCDRTAWLELHHIIHWANDGLTNENNLITMCWHHHHMLHEGHWTMSINKSTRDITITRPDGRTYTPPTEPDQLSEHTRTWLTQLTDSPPTGGG